VLRTHLRPSFHPLAPLEYSDLAARCWSSRPERRPTALQLVAALEQLLSAASTEKVSAAADVRKFCSGGPRLTEQQRKARQEGGGRAQQQQLHMQLQMQPQRQQSKGTTGAAQAVGEAASRSALDPNTAATASAPQ
jgi:hypothetical protein